MDEKLIKYLGDNEISFEIYNHKAVFTIEQSKSNKDIQKIPGARSKNLFLKDEKNQFYLVCIVGEKKLDMKNL